MRIIEEKIYTFDELDKQAKEKAISECRMSRQTNYELCDLFTEDSLTLLKELLPNSEINLYYDLSFSQSDYLELNGYFDVDDLLNQLINHYSEKEIKTLNHYFKMTKNYTSWYLKTKIYNYSSYDFRLDLDDYLTTTLEDLRYHNINKDLITSFVSDSANYIYTLCNKLKKNGYEDLYPDDEYYVELIENNEYEFYKNGELYC